MLRQYLTEKFAHLNFEVIEYTSGLCACHHDLIVFFYVNADTVELKFNGEVEIIHASDPEFATKFEQGIASIARRQKEWNRNKHLR